MDIGRILKHLCTTGLHLRSRFPRETLEAIKQEIAKSEALHNGELRFAIETALDLPPLLHGLSSRQRAFDVFSRLRVWDTEMNSGVLIYLLLVDHKVEIVAARGIAAKVDQADWEMVCREMERAFRGRDGVGPPAVASGPAIARARIGCFFSAAGVGHRNEQRRVDLPVAGRP